MFILIFNKNFDEAYKKIIKGNTELEKKTRKVLHLLEENPNYPSLKTHKANTKNHGVRWSSWVTGDLRIIWDYDSENRLIILLLDIGKHTGLHKVYR